MKLNTNLQSDIALLSSAPKLTIDQLTIPESVWDEHRQEFAETRGLVYQARRLRSMAWLDKQRLSAFVNDQGLQYIFQDASLPAADDEYTDVLVAQQVVQGLTAEQLGIDERKLIRSAETQLAKHTVPNHSDIIKGLIMASNIRLLQTNEQVSQEIVDQWRAYLEAEINDERNRNSPSYVTNCCVMMRILWPQYFKDVNLNALGLDNFGEILDNAQDAGLYIDLAAKLRFMYAAEIIYTPVGVEIIDKPNSPVSSSDILPEQIVF